MKIFIFANEAASSGADGLIVVFPERFYGQSYIVDFFLSIADVSPIPIWIHAVPFRDGFGGVNSFKKFDYNILTSQFTKHTWREGRER